MSAGLSKQHDVGQDYSAQRLKEWAAIDFDSFAAALAQVLPEYVKLDWEGKARYRDWFERWQEAGVTILPNHYYSPIPDLSVAKTETLTRREPLIGVNMRENAQLEMLKLLERFRCEYSALDARGEHRDDGRYFKLGPYPILDAMVTYAYVRNLKPKRIIEIGSGHSTLILSEACLKNAEEGHPCEFISIDPYPSYVLAFAPKGLTAHRAVGAENVELELFTNLCENDILFIDSTHVWKPGNDVDYEYFTIIPSLQPGVHVHIHDIFIPKMYPLKWTKNVHIFWNEQALLTAFLTNNDSFDVSFATAYLCDRKQTIMRESFPADMPVHQGGSFWIRRNR